MSLVTCRDNKVPASTPRRVVNVHNACAGTENFSAQVPIANSRGKSGKSQRPVDDSQLPRIVLGSGRLVRSTRLMRQGHQGGSFPAMTRCGAVGPGGYPPTRPRTLVSGDPRCGKATRPRSSLSTGDRSASTRKGGSVATERLRCMSMIAAELRRYFESA
jgi:hypothetical protein